MKNSVKEDVIQRRGSDLTRVDLPAFTCNANNLALLGISVPFPAYLCPQREYPVFIKD